MERNGLSFGNICGSDVVLTEDCMDGVDLIFQVAAIGILVAVLNMLLVRAGREDQAMMTTIAGLVVVLLVVIREISELFDTIKSLFGL